MQKLKRIYLIPFFLVFSFVYAPAFAAEDFSPVTALKNYYVDPYTGSANFTIPIFMPAARKTLPQKLNLIYSSRATNGWLGAGWKLDLAVIERSTKNGYPKYDSSDKFIFSLGEQQNDLVFCTGQEYRAKTADIAWKFIFDGSRWTVKDNLGITYYFGLDNSLSDFSRTKDPGNSGKIFRWRLSKITDTSGNNIIFKYLADKIEIYYSEKTEVAKSSYKKEDYDYLVSINFSNDRVDKLSNFRPGFGDSYPLDGAGRVNEIKILYRDQLTKRYLLEYKYSLVTGRSTLDKITEFGSDNLTTNPPIKFNYSTSASEYETVKYNREASSPPWRIHFADNLNRPKGNFKLTPDGFVDENGLVTPITWSKTYNTASGNISDFSWSVTPSPANDIHNRKRGNLHIEGRPGQIFHAWTYIVLQIWSGSDGNKQYVVANSNTCNANYFLSNSSSQNGPYSLGQPIAFGNLKSMNKYVFRLDITGYNFSNNFVLDYKIAENLSFWETVNSTGDIPKPTLSGDFNGDGMTDLGNFVEDLPGIISIRISPSDKRDFLRNNKWGEIPVLFGSQTILGDFNGDGKTDICGNADWIVAISDGNKFINKGSWLSGAAGSAATGDFNGDGLADICFFSYSGADLYAKAAFSDGQKFQFQSQFKLSNLAYEKDDKLFTGDFNGDGVTDFAIWRKSQKTLYIRGYNNSWSSSVIINDPKVLSGDFRLEFSQDFNFDGKSDLFYYNLNEPSFYIMNLAGSAAGAPIKLNLDFDAGYSGSLFSNPLQSGDFNGDGITDFLIYDFMKGTQVAYSNKSDVPDLLMGVENGWGARLEFKYRLSSEYDYLNSGITPKLPFVIPVISEVVISDGLGSSYKTIYLYSKGYYDSASKEFRGFGYVVKIDDERNSTENWFLQDDIYKGKISRQKASDKDGNLFSEIKNTWSSTLPYARAYIISLAETNQYSYDGDATYKLKKTTFRYDTYGNPTSVKEWLDAADSMQEKETVTEYAYNTKDWLISYPCHIFVEDSRGNKVKEKWFYYDGASSYTTAPTKGRLTKEEAGIYNPITQQRKKAATQYNYDTYGNLIKVTDPLGRITITEYDADLHTYPSKVINALGHVTQYTYDQKTGQILTAIDQNLQTTKNVYDVLGRLIRVIGPADSEEYPGVTYSYNLISRPTRIIKNVKTSYVAAQPDYLAVYSFYDGLGRLIQTKTPAENNPLDGRARQVISDVVRYDFRGQVKEKYLPYFAGYSASYNQDFTAKPKFTYRYDCLGRLVQTTNPDGTYAQNNYSDWIITSIDENGNRTARTQDAFGRTIKVEEYNGSQVFTTAYTYDALDNLIRIRDDQNNITEFAYDSLGSRLRINDPDMGIWNYEYDLTGNLIKQIDGRGQVIEFSYDALNRVKTKKSAQTQAVLASYIYDDMAKQYCTGRLAKITDTSGSEEYFYDRLGRQIKTIKIVGGASFTIERTYDALGRVLTLKYPDGEVITYSYNPQGIEKVEGLSPGTVPYVRNVNYSATSQITRAEYGNNTATNYSYDAYTLRLAGILTQSPAGKIQDLNYTFDNAGNITYIRDYVNSATQSFLYDGLNRLIKAQGAYGAFTYSYDSIGNITYKEGVSYNYNLNKPHAVVSTSDGTAFEYDANGNLSHKTNAQNTNKFIYDVENRLVRIEAAPVSDPSIKTIQIYLQPGINYISLPFGTVYKIEDILAAIQNSREDVAYWDTTQNKYLYNAKQPDFDQLQTMEYAKGYWIYINNPGGVTLNVTGRMPDNYQANLKTGWNAIGCAKDNEVDVEAGLKPLTLGTDYTSVLRYKSDGTWQEYSVLKKDFAKIKPGEGYWVKMAKDKAWNIDNTPAGSPLAEFSYDSAGNRVKKTSGGKATIYISSLYEKDSDGTTRKHIFLGATRICTKRLSPAGGLSLSYYHSDHLGSSNVITDSGGNQAQLVEYRPFGSLTKGLSPQGTVPDYFFTGKELDRPTGLYYYGARYYNPSLGRFIQPDPLIQDVYDPQNLNHYAYCRNNPLILTDPDGTSWSSTFNSWGSSLSSSWNSLSSWASSSWQDSMRSLNQTLQNLQNSINSLTTQAMKTFTGIGSGLYNFGQSAWRETNVWGSALGMGMNYGANIIIPPNTTLYKGLDLISNTLTQPGYNYGMWMYGDKSFRNLLGASLDAGWAITSIMAPLMSSSATYYQYYGPKSNPASTWVTKTLYNPEIAMQKLSAPVEWDSVRQINVPWYRYVGGPRIASPKFGYLGGGAEYKIGGFELKNWIEYYKDWQ